MTPTQYQAPWLPRVPQRKRLELFRTRVSSVRPHAPARLSEFLTLSSIRIFPSPISKIEVIESLVGSLPGHDHVAILQAIWNREREGTLIIKPETAILRGRLDNVHHIRAALGICPAGVEDPSNPDRKTRFFVVFAGPTNQTRLHMALLTGVSALFRNRSQVSALAKLKTPEAVLEELRRLEGLEQPWGLVKRWTETVSHFFRMYFAWNREEIS